MGQTTRLKSVYWKMYVKTCVANTFHYRNKHIPDSEDHWVDQAWIESEKFQHVKIYPKLIKNAIHLSQSFINN